MIFLNPEFFTITSLFDVIIEKIGQKEFLTTVQENFEQFKQIIKYGSLIEEKTEMKNLFSNFLSWKLLLFAELKSLEAIKPETLIKLNDKALIEQAIDFIFEKDKNQLEDIFLQFNSALRKEKNYITSFVKIYKKLGSIQSANLDKNKLSLTINIFKKTIDTLEYLSTDEQDKLKLELNDILENLSKPKLEIKQVEKPAPKLTNEMQIDKTSILKNMLGFPVDIAPKKNNFIEVFEINNGKTSLTENQITFVQSKLVSYNNNILINILDHLLFSKEKLPHEYKYLIQNRLPIAKDEQIPYLIDFFGLDAEGKISKNQQNLFSHAFSQLFQNTKLPLSERSFIASFLIKTFIEIGINPILLFENIEIMTYLPSQFITSHLHLISKI
jgi:hypothetical protein